MEKTTKKTKKTETQAYAVIKFGGRQFIVREGDQFEIERQSSMDNEVLGYFDGKKLTVGTPFVKDAKVEIEKVEDTRDDKIDVIRFRAKSRHKRKNGHKQPISVVKVRSISYGA